MTAVRVPHEVTDSEGVRTAVEISHDLYTEYKVRLVVNAGTINWQSTWLSPDEAEILAAHLTCQAVEARCRNMEAAA
jgi:hypothetical protein